MSKDGKDLKHTTTAPENNLSNDQEALKKLRTAYPRLIELVAQKKFSDVIKDIGHLLAPLQLENISPQTLPASAIFTGPENIFHVIPALILRAYCLAQMGLNHDYYVKQNIAFSLMIAMSRINIYPDSVFKQMCLLLLLHELHKIDPEQKLWPQLLSWFLNVNSLSIPEILEVAFRYHVISVSEPNVGTERNPVIQCHLHLIIMGIIRHQLNNQADHILENIAQVFIGNAKKRHTHLINYGFVKKEILISETDFRPYKFILERIQAKFSIPLDAKQNWKVLDNDDTTDHKLFVDAALADDAPRLENLLRPIEFKIQFLAIIVHEGKSLTQIAQQRDLKSILGLWKKLSIIPTVTPSSAAATDTAATTIKVVDSSAGKPVDAGEFVDIASAFGDQSIHMPMDFSKISFAAIANNTDFKSMGDMLKSLDVEAEVEDANADIADRSIPPIEFPEIPYAQVYFNSMDLGVTEDTVNYHQINVIEDILISLVLENLRITNVFYNVTSLHENEKAILAFRFAISISKAQEIIEKLNNQLELDHIHPKHFASLHNTQLQILPNEVRLKVVFLNTDDFERELEAWQKAERVGAILLIFSPNKNWKAYTIRKQGEPLICKAIEADTALGKELAALKPEAIPLPEEKLEALKKLLIDQPLFHLPRFQEIHLDLSLVMNFLLPKMKHTFAQWQEQGLLHYYYYQEYRELIAPVIADLNASAQQTAWYKARQTEKYTVFGSVNFPDNFAFVRSIRSSIFAYVHDEHLIEPVPLTKAAAPDAKETAKSATAAATANSKATSPLIARSLVANATGTTAAAGTAPADAKETSASGATPTAATYGK